MTRPIILPGALLLRLLRIEALRLSGGSAQDRETAQVLGEWTARKERV